MFRNIIVTMGINIKRNIIILCCCRKNNWLGGGEEGVAFPKIPDMNLKTDMKLEDALSLLLSSIASEETSLSKLLDAEIKKILYVFDECKLQQCSIQDVKDINKSVNETILNMTKLHMLLQSKLDSIMELLPAATLTTESSKPIPFATMRTNTTTSATSTSTTTTAAARKMECSLIGMGIGLVSNRADSQYYKAAVLQANISADSSVNQKALVYTVKGNIKMAAYADSIDIECSPSVFPDSLVIQGKGVTKRNMRNSPDITAPCSFVLRI